MSNTGQTAMMDRVVDLIPRDVRHEAARLIQRVWDRLPPVAIMHRLDALERHIDRRFKELDARLEEMERRIRVKAA